MVASRRFPAGHRRIDTAVVETSGTVGPEVAVLVVLCDAHRSRAAGVGRRAAMAAVAQCPRRNVAVRRLVQRWCRAAGIATARFDTPLLGHVHLIPTVDPRRRRSHETTPTTFDA